MHETPDALPWVKDSANHMFGDNRQRESLKICEDLAGLGCTEISTVPIKGMGSTDMLLPSSQGQREAQAVFDWYAAVAKKHEFRPIKGLRAEVPADDVRQVL